MKNIAAVQKEISFGGGGINGIIMYIDNPRFPFGGADNSDIGNYRSKTGSDIFSHHKNITYRPARIETGIKIQLTI
jgi:acyl-CoA reductase-like NAD-dependent aldehyde dehydrogenase